MKPGEVNDRFGIPIHPGDLLKSFHFQGARRKKYYLYHVAVHVNDETGMEMVPVSHLQPDKVKSGGRCRLNQDLGDNAEVIAGYGPGNLLDFTERPKQWHTTMRPASDPLYLSELGIDAPIKP